MNYQRFACSAFLMISLTAVIRTSSRFVVRVVARVFLALCGRLPRSSFGLCNAVHYAAWDVDCMWLRRSSPRYFGLARKCYLLVGGHSPVTSIRHGRSHDNPRGVFTLFPEVAGNQFWPPGSWWIVAENLVRAAESSQASAS